MQQEENEYGYTDWQPWSKDLINMASKWLVRTHHGLDDNLTAFCHQVNLLFKMGIPTKTISSITQFFPRERNVLQFLNVYSNLNVQEWGRDGGREELTEAMWEGVMSQALSLRPLVRLSCNVLLYHQWCHDYSDPSLPFCVCFPTTAWSIQSGHHRSLKDTIARQKMIVNRLEDLSDWALHAQKACIRLPKYLARIKSSVECQCSLCHNAMRQTWQYEMHHKRHVIYVCNLQQIHDF